MNKSLPLKAALLLSSQSKASLLVEIAGRAIDYLLVAYSPDTMGEKHTLEIFRVQERQAEEQSHKGMAFTSLDKLVEFVDNHGFVTDSGWIAEEETRQ